MNILYGAGFGEEDRKAQIPVLHSNVIAAIQALLDAVDSLELEVVATDSADVVRDLADDQIIDEELAEHVKALWADPAVQEAYSRRNEFQIPDSGKYFIKRLDDMISPGFIPSVDDVLKARVRTTGIVEESYLIDDVQFVMFDVGGQRNERKKWIHCFDDVTAVIFVAAISEYDQVLYEDASQNRMVESLTLFREICNSKFFTSTSILLFLNKRDLFADKIKVKDIRQPDPADPSRMLFDDYDGGCDYDAGVSYIVQKYLAQDTAGQENGREIFYQVTCATDSENTATVMNAARASILKDNILGSGFMD